MANAKINKSDLGYLGTEAEMQIIKSFIEDKLFFLSIEPVLDQNSFAGEYGSKIREICGIIKDYYSKNNYVPSYADLELILKERSRNENDLTENMEFLNEMKSDRYLQGIEVAKDIARKFFKQQATIKVLNKGLQDMEKNGYEEGVTLQKIQDELNNVGKTVSEKVGYAPMDIYDSIFTRKNIEKIATGIPELDEQMHGGISKKQLGLILAGTGVGKSTLGAIMCVRSAVKGHKVLHIYFEEDELDMSSKYIAALTGCYTNEMFEEVEEGRKEEIRKLLDLNPQYKTALGDNLITLRMDNGETQVEDIKARIQQLATAQGWKPDMVFIDYFSCLQKSSDKRNEYNNEWKAGEKCMKKLSQMAQGLDIAVWVAEQTNRNGAKVDTANDRIANIQGSFRITQPCAFILYLDRVAQRTNGINNRANLYLDKCRGCEPKAWENIYLNNGNCQIDLSDTEGDVDANIDDIMNDPQEEKWENQCNEYLKFVNDGQKN